MFVIQLILTLLISFHSQASDPLHEQYQISITKLLSNLNYPGIPKGAVIASPSKHDPDYFFHWVRDAALTIDVVVDLYNESTGTTKTYYDDLIKGYITYSKLNQETETITGLGEPKFHIDGTAYWGPWARPQNDGPALRASTLIKYSLAQNNSNSVLDTVITRDIQYVIDNWHLSSFDLWEEIRGQHFYTLIVQRKALIEAQNYFQSKRLQQKIKNTLQLIDAAIRDHFENRGFIVATLNRTEGIDYKYSNLDVAVVLGLLHGNTFKNIISIMDSKVLTTIHRLEEAFYNLYPINYKNFSSLSPVIGRYPEDRYYGGNPWFLTTHAVAEIYYKMAIQSGDKKYFDLGDEYLYRALIHKDETGSMDEQMSRYSGYMESARDLTWSYASYITAYRARIEALKKYYYFNSIRK